MYQILSFLCSNLWLGGLCTDNNSNNDGDDANNETSAARWTKHDGIRLFGITPNEQRRKERV